MDKSEVIMLLSILPILILIFVKHDEFMVLVLIELAFIGAIGLMYTGAVILAIAIWSLIEKIVWRIRHGKEIGD